jgi:hypothetical protein
MTRTIDRVAELQRLDDEVVTLRANSEIKEAEALRCYAPLLLDELLATDWLLDSSQETIIRHFFDGRPPLVRSSQRKGLYLAQLEARTKDQSSHQLFLDALDEELRQRGILLRVNATLSWDYSWCVKV